MRAPPQRSVSGATVGPLPGRSSAARAERALWRFLERELLPLAQRERRIPLVRALRPIVEEKDRARLGRLPGRTRAELLDLVEARAQRLRSSPPPQAVVGLVSALLPAATRDEAVPRWRTTAPSR